MYRHVFLGLFALLALVPVGYSGPIDGGAFFRKTLDKMRVGEEKDLLPGTEVFYRDFVAGQRACVIAIGDHDPEVPVGISVYEFEKGKQGKLVAEDLGKKNDKEFQDYAAVVWYPTRTRTYLIEVKSYGRVENVVSIAVN